MSLPLWNLDFLELCRFRFEDDDDIYSVLAYFLESFIVYTFFTPIVSTLIFV